MHSTASDGSLPPEVVVERALRAGLAGIALTDHDTVAGVPAAETAGERLGIRVVGGCEFSSAAPWGEMHVLGYFLPSHSEWDAGAFYDVASVRLTVTGRNLSDSRHVVAESDIGDAMFYIAPPRRVTAEASYRF